jgi:hypothetical protein
MLRHNKRVQGAVVVGALLFSSSACGFLRAQQTTTPMGGTPTSSNPMSGRRGVLNEETPPDVSSARMQEQRARAAQDDRHKRMAQDADKLLALATELKADVDKATKNETSVTAFQKANEIEKLAHDVKERLRN